LGGGGLRYSFPHS